MAKGRGRLSVIDRLPQECDEVVSWAATALVDRDQDQTIIYGEFVEKLIAIQGETGLGFTIPSRSSFNRHSIKLSQMTRRLEQARVIAETISERMDAKSSDDLTLIAAETIKTLVLEILTSKGEAGLDPKGAKALADALRSAALAQNISTVRRQKHNETFEKQIDETLEKVSGEAGLSSEVIARLRSEFLGVKPPVKDSGAT